MPLYVTDPATAPLGPVTVNVVVVIVAEFIAMLKVALIVVFTATFVAPAAGITDTTDGTVTTSWPHPATKATNRVARQYVIPTLILCISSLMSNCGGTASKAHISIARRRSRHDVLSHVNNWNVSMLVIFAHP
jgi:hypothetical protein